MFYSCTSFFFFVATLVGFAHDLELKNDSLRSGVSHDVDQFADVPLLPVKPEGSRVVRRRVDNDFGFTELTFLNGVQIILKSTDFDNDSIFFAGFSPGGKSLYLDEDFMSAHMATTIVTMSGLGDFDYLALSEKLSDNTAQLSPYIDEIYEGISGLAATGDLETLLQLNYLYFTSTRRDEDSFNTLISQLKNQSAEMRANPMYAYIDTLNRVVSSNSPRIVTIPTEEQINQIRLNHALNIYNDRFSDAGDFKFVMVGKFNVNSVTPLLETYLGGLPSRRRVETWRDVTPQFPQGVRVVEYPNNSEEPSRVDIIMKGTFRWNPRERVLFEMFTALLNINLSEIMPQESDTIHKMNVSGGIIRFPNPQYSLNIELYCVPENVNSLTERLFEEVEKFKANGPTVANLNNVKETFIGAREATFEENKFWCEELLNTYRHGDKPMTLQEYKRIVNSVSPRDIRRVIRQYFNENNYVMGVFNANEE